MRIPWRGFRMLVFSVAVACGRRCAGLFGFIRVRVGVFGAWRGGCCGAFGVVVFTRPGCHIFSRRRVTFCGGQVTFYCPGFVTVICAGAVTLSTVVVAGYVYRHR